MPLKSSFRLYQKLGVRRLIPFLDMGTVRSRERTVERMGAEVSETALNPIVA